MVNVFLLVKGLQSLIHLDLSSEIFYEDSMMHSDIDHSKGLWD